MQKVLIITYYWPPAGGPGVQRWLKFATHLKNFNIEPILYVPENPHYPIQDKSLLDEIPKDIKILKKPIAEPYRFAKIFSKKKTERISSGIIDKKKSNSLLQNALLFVRGNFFIPDARKYWVKPSVEFLKNYLEENNVSTVITTGPPHSLHLIGLKLKENSSLKWIADFRDPWTSIGYHKELKLTKFAEKKHVQLEKEVLTKASHILTTSFKTKQEFATITQKPITVITNGFEQKKHEKIPLDEKFTVSHIGSLLAERNPINLWKALAELVQENRDFKEHFQLQLIGKVSGEVVQSIKNEGLQDFLLNRGYVSHRKAIEYQRKSQVLLLIEIDKKETEAIIPGKLFEYLATNRPIIAIGPKNWDVKKILADVRVSIPFLYLEKEKIKSQILKYFKAFQENSLKENPVGLEKYTRKALTEKLSEVIKKTAK
ncbi:glycosyl transferase family 1 [Mesonia maritima]|uniref:Glycosyltransferase involved in cell wall biosynthesis n=1 Tax=Mesonia maritima TaxID=1793873 RepID=A0ABU1K996_9FLAO|nr:glycosyl transferase family 1 [Mesonia maritima]MDR6302174.1 glycosyltransferase involved in cell wall biosynthesis [Mesonia maritima]